MTMSTVRLKRLDGSRMYAARGVERAHGLQINHQAVIL